MTGRGLRRRSKRGSDFWLARLARRLGGVRGSEWLLQAVRRWTARRYAGSRQATCVIEDYDGDLKFRLDRSAHIGSAIYWHGYHHRGLARLLDRELEPHMTFVDVGANVGELAVFAAKRLTDGHVVAVEPQGRAFRILEENVALNSLGNVEALNLGLSYRTGTGRLYGPKEGIAGWNEGAYTTLPRPDRSRFVQTFTVTRLDKLLKDRGIESVDVLKVDVEGAELEVLRGGESCLREYSPLLLVELNRPGMEKTGRHPKDLVAFLRECGYSIFEAIRPARSSFRYSYRLVPLDRVLESAEDRTLDVVCRGTEG